MSSLIPGPSSAVCAVEGTTAFDPADHDNWFDADDCQTCGGEGFIFDCFDGFCADCDIGCDDCTRPCPDCGGIDH